MISKPEPEGSEKKHFLKTEPEKIRLEYILIYKTSGLPMYMRCMGSLCQLVDVDEMLVTGFLSAISTIPSLFGLSKSARYILMDFGYLSLIFSRSLAGDHVVCIGFPSGAWSETVKNEMMGVFDSIEKILQDHFKDCDWNYQSKKRKLLLEHFLMEDILPRLFSVEHVREARGHHCQLTAIVSQEKPC